MGQLKNLSKYILTITVLFLIAGCSRQEASEYIVKMPTEMVDTVVIDENSSTNAVGEETYINIADYVSFANLANWHDASAWRKIYIGDDFYEMTLESIHRGHGGAKERAIRVLGLGVREGFVPIQANFSGEITVNGNIEINLNPENRSNAYFTIYESCWERIPVISTRIHPTSTRSVVFIRNIDKLLEHFDLTVPKERHHKTITIADVTATFTNYSVVDFGWSLPSMGFDLQSLISYSEPELEAETVGVDYVTVINRNNASGLHNLQAGDEFGGLIVEYARSSRFRSRGEDEFSILFQDAIFSGQLRLRGSLILRISVDGLGVSSPNARFYCYFTVNDEYLKFLPVTATDLRGSRYVLFQRDGNNEELYHMLEMLNINYDEIEFVRAHEHFKTAEIEIPDIYLTLNRFELVDEMYSILLHYRFEDLYIIEIIH